MTEKCPTCGSSVRIEGNTTKYFVPVPMGTREAAEAHCAKFSPHPKAMMCGCGWCVGRNEGEALFIAGAAHRDSVLRELLTEAIEHIANARSEASSRHIAEDYVIDECCLAISKINAALAEEKGEA